MKLLLMMHLPYGGVTSGIDGAQLREPTLATD